MTKLTTEELDLLQFGRVLHKRERVGKYRADYSPLTPEEIAAPDPELDELYRNSAPVSRS